MANQICCGNCRFFEDFYGRGFCYNADSNHNNKRVERDFCCDRWKDEIKNTKEESRSVISDKNGNCQACPNCHSGDYLYNKNGEQNEYCGKCGQKLRNNSTYWCKTCRFAMREKYKFPCSVCYDHDKFEI